MKETDLTPDFKKLSAQIFHHEMSKGLFLDRLKEQYGENAFKLFVFVLTCGHFPSPQEWRVTRSLKLGSSYKDLEDELSMFKTGEPFKIHILRGNFIEFSDLNRNKQISGIPIVAQWIMKEISSVGNFTPISFDATSFSQEKSSVIEQDNWRVKSESGIASIFFASLYAAYRELQFQYPKLAKVFKRLVIQRKRVNISKSTHISILIDSLIVAPTPISNRDEMDQLQILLECKLIEIIPVVHDLLPALKPRFFPPIGSSSSLQFMHLVLMAEKIFAVSEKVGQDLIKFANFVGRSISKPVGIYHLEPCIFNQTSSVQGNHSRVENINSRPYFLCISTFEPRKNLLSTLLALTHLLRLDFEVDFYFIGSHGWDNKELYWLMEKEFLRSNIKIFRNISDAEKNNLIYGSLATIYPSTDEGFGMPVYESLVLQKFTIYHNAAPMNTFNELLNALPIDMTHQDHLNSTLEAILNGKILESKPESISNCFRDIGNTEFIEYVRRAIGHSNFDQ
jgi:glycosyltransferase involved in cell wall biosynthesis